MLDNFQQIQQLLGSKQAKIKEKKNRPSYHRLDSSNIQGRKSERFLLNW